jgi:GMP synthase (glutamine-hydrolysing)
VISVPGGFDTVLVVDFGAQYAQLIARRVRECHVYSEIVPSTMPVAEMLAKRPKAIILSGGPSSVYADGAPPAPAGLFDAGVPVLGICYGFQLMVAGLGGTVAHTGAREYGATVLVRGDDAVPTRGEYPPQTPPAPGGKSFPPDPLDPPSGGVLLAGLPSRQTVWMSHGDTATAAPPGFAVTAKTEATPVAAVENVTDGMFGVQFHPEVLHTEHGARILARFLELAGCRPSWTMLNIVEEQVTAIREQVGDGRAICGLSGGVDSAVAAALVQRAIGDRLTCVFVDHGLLRKGEAEQVEQDFVAATGVKLTVATEAEAFLSALAGAVDPEQKR